MQTSIFATVCEWTLLQDINTPSTINLLAILVEGMRITNLGVICMHIYTDTRVASYGTE